MVSQAMNACTHKMTEKERQIFLDEMNSKTYSKFVIYFRLSMLLCVIVITLTAIRL
jgi:hypothetical protein